MGGKLEMKLSRINNQESFGLEQEIETQNFFQLSTLKRRRRNNISEIMLDDGIWINNMEFVWGKNPRPKG